MFKVIHILGCAAILSIRALPLYSATLESIDLDAIEVAVYASKALEKKQLRIRSADDFKRLDLSFTNRGSEPVVIRSVDISIPFAEAVPAKTQVVYGSSGMGQRPLRREAVSDEGNRSYSYMFGMVRADLRILTTYSTR